MADDRCRYGGGTSNLQSGLEGFDCLPLLLWDVGPPIVVTTQHGLLQAAGTIFS
jgi:hypothetical protein